MSAVPAPTSTEPVFAALRLSMAATPRKFADERSAPETKRYDHDWPAINGAVHTFEVAEVDNRALDVSKPSVRLTVVGKFILPVARNVSTPGSPLPAVVVVAFGPNRTDERSHVVARVRLPRAFDLVLVPSISTPGWMCSNTSGVVVNPEFKTTPLPLAFPQFAVRAAERVAVFAANALASLATVV